MQKQELIDYLKTLKPIGTHSHHLSDADHAGMTLAGILEKSYCGWMDQPSRNAVDAEGYILRNACNSYFRWMLRAIEELYGRSFTVSNFDELSRRVEQAHKDPSWHIQILKERCGYDKILLDYYDDPGSDLSHGELFVPVLRCNMFAVGNVRGVHDHNGNNPFEYLHRDFTDLEEYLSTIAQTMRRYKAIKFALAYDCDNEILCFDRQKAEQAFQNKDASSVQRKNYYDYMVYALCKKAGELGVAVQFHTGLGKLKKSSPIYLKELIEACPETKFDLFHGGFPWTDDMLALVHNYGNVYADICWLPLISTAYAQRFVREALEVGSAHRLLWGCDTWTSEESYGAVLAGREVIAGALASMTQDGAVTDEYACYIARRIWRENAKELFVV